MNKQNVLYGIIGILAGFIIGFFFANTINRNASQQSTKISAPINQSVGNNPQLPQQQQQQQSGVDIKESQAGSGGGAMMPQVAETLEKADKEPNNFSAQMQAGLMHLRIQNPDKAKEYFQRAAQVREDNFAALTMLGNAFFDIGSYEEAEKWYTLALEKNPDDVNVRTDLGSTFMERQPPDLDRAVKEYQTSLSKDPKHESTLFNLSLALMRKGDAQGAQETLNQLEKINPSSDLIPKLKEKLAQASPK